MSASVISRSESARATWCGVLPVARECSLIVPRILRVDVPDPVAEGGPVESKSTEGSDDEDGEQRPYHCSVHAFEGSPANRHSVEVLMLWGHKARLWLPSITLHANWLGDGRISCAGIAIGGTRTGRGGSNPWRIERRFDPAGQTRVPTNQKLVGKSRGNLVFAGEPP